MVSLQEIVMSEKTEIVMSEKHKQNCGVISQRTRPH